LSPLIHQMRTYRSLDDLESLRPAWEKLLTEFSGATTFSTWEWLAPWWRAFGKGRELLVLAFFDESASLVGLAPLAISRRRVAPLLELRVLSLWGDGTQDSDNLDFPVRAGCEDAVAAALLDYLKKESRLWDFCEFNTMPPDSPVARCLAKRLGDRGWTAYDEQIVCLAISLPETWEAYLGQLSSKERGKIAYYQNRLQRKYRMRLRKCERGADLRLCLEALFNLHQKRWLSAGRPGSFARTARRDFYCEMAHLLLNRGWLEFWLLELNGEPAAAQFGFRYGRTVFQLQEGFDPAYSADSVGFVLRAQVVREFIAAGVRRYDFLAGEDSAKLRWAAQPGHYIGLQFAPPLTRGSLCLRLIHGAGKHKEKLRAYVPRNAWRALHAAKQKFRGAGSASSLGSAAEAAPTNVKLAISKSFSRSDSAAEAK
jgi:CelD/BcsL family acetyltransferase involved in cellulose biosynthesis